MEQEANFINKIDCNFPYNDNNLSLSLIEEAASISTNALCAVVEEICRVPRGIAVTRKRQVELYNTASSKLNHPLRDLVIESGMKLISNETAPDDEVFRKFKFIKKFPHQYCALNIVYFTGSPDNEEIDVECDKIINYWNTLL